MLLRIPALLSPEAVRQARQALVDAPWGAGAVTAGAQAAIAKRNQQLPEDCAPSRLIQQLVLKGLQTNSTFFSAALPKHISPPLINRYGGEHNTFGDHVDGAVRRTDSGGRIRTDISCTVFLSDPDEYEGGNLVIQDTYGNQEVKLLAGDIVLYPGTSVHRVEPVTRGFRLGAFFWVQSMVRSDEQRRLLFDMDTHLMQLRSEVGESSPPVIGLTGVYHNLLRAWLDV